MADVKFTATSNFSKVEGDLRKIQRENIKLREEIRKVATESKKGSEEGRRGQQNLSRAVSGGVQSLARQAAAYLSVQAAIQAVNQELEKRIRLENESTSTQIKVADAQAKAIRNLGDVTDKQAKQFLGRVEGLARSTGIKREQLLAASSDVLSATGGNRQQTLDILRQAGPLLRDDQAQLGEFGGAVADLQRATGVKDVKQAIGLVLSTQGQARITGLEGFTNAAPALAAVTGTDSSGDAVRAARQGGALFSAIGAQTADKKGAVSKTATIALATQLQRFLPEEDIVRPGQETIKGTGLSTLFERIEALQKDATLRQKFLFGDKDRGIAAASFEKEAQTPIRRLLSDPNSAEAQSLRAAFAKISLDAGLVEQKQRQLTGLTAQLSTASAQRQLDVAVEGRQSEDIAGSRRALARRLANESQKIVRQAQRGKFDAFVDFLEERGQDFAFSNIEGGGVKAAEKEVVQNLVKLLGRTGQSGRFLKDGELHIDERLIAGIKDEKDRKQIEQMFEIIRQLAELNRKTESNSQAARASAAKAAPGAHAEK